MYLARCWSSGILKFIVADLKNYRGNSSWWLCIIGKRPKHLTIYSLQFTSPLVQCTFLKANEIFLEGVRDLLLVSEFITSSAQCSHYIYKRRQQQRKTVSLLRDFFFFSLSFAASFVLSFGQVNEIFISVLLSQLGWVFLQVFAHLEISDNTQPQSDALLKYRARGMLIPPLFSPRSSRIL